MQKSNIVSWERENEIGILSISNGKENYLNVPDFLDIYDLKRWMEEEGLKGVLITGIGRNFSAGADLDKLKSLVASANKLEASLNKGKEILDYIEDLNIPVVAAINGLCFGGGLEIALASHIRIASERALFAFPETNHGLIPGLGGTYRLTKILGKNAIELILSGDMINADKAKELALVHTIANEKNSQQFAMDYLKRLVADRPVEVIHAAMKAIRNADTMGSDQALKAETELFCNLAVNINDHEE
ncbi:MAG: enoyl-CoA hydratase/isomerase family protein [Bacteroidetes bacterium]|nr:enoyl-CoA hydratase/isomerase family protein [Bacteroidota bacterium]